MFCLHLLFFAYSFVHVILHFGIVYRVKKDVCRLGANWVCIQDERNTGYSLPFLGMSVYPLHKVVCESHWSSWKQASRSHCFSPSCWKKPGLPHCGEGEHKKFQVCLLLISVPLLNCGRGRKELRFLSKHFFPGHLTATLSFTCRKGLSSFLDLIWIQ